MIWGLLVVHGESIGTQDSYTSTMSFEMCVVFSSKEEWRKDLQSKLHGYTGDRMPSEFTGTVA